MTDIYDRLDEIEGITRVLVGDVDRLRRLVGGQVAISDEQESNRRLYVRAVFALVEALVEQHKQLLLDLVKQGSIALAAGIREALSENAPYVKDNGTVQYRMQFLQIERKLRAVYCAAGAAFKQPLVVDYTGSGWQSFQAALGVRNRLTHPKTFRDCYVDEDALSSVDRGHDWFRALSNEFTRVAQEYRNASQSW
jgi:hypothetical protein